MGSSRPLTGITDLSLEYDEPLSGELMATLPDGDFGHVYVMTVSDESAIYSAEPFTLYHTMTSPGETLVFQCGYDMMYSSWSTAEDAFYWTSVGYATNASSCPTLTMYGD